MPPPSGPPAARIAGLAPAGRESRGRTPPDPGTSPLETAEWLGLVLGGPRRAATETAREILARRDLIELAASSPRELAVEFGLGRNAALRVAAAFALGRRRDRLRRPIRPSMRSPRQVYELLEARLQGLERETFLALLLDGKHRLRRVVPVSAGTLTTSLVHPREVFRAAIREASAAVIVAHNHPSGDPEPSREDLEVTRRLRAAGELLGVPLLDHVVFGEHAYVSLRERTDDWSWLAPDAGRAAPGGQAGAPVTKIAAATPSAAMAAVSTDGR